MKKLIVIAISLIVLAACNDHKINGQRKVQVIANKISDDTAASTSCPYLTSDNKDNPVLSWVKEISDSDAVVCFSVWDNNLNRFSNNIVIPQSKNVDPHSENMPKIIFKLSGEIIAVWGANNSNPKNKYAGLIFYAQSFDGGKSWTESRPLVPDTSSYDQRYFDLALLSNGEAGIIWLDSRKKTDKEGSTLYFASTKGEGGFQGGQAVVETICQCCRTDLFVDSKGYVHAAFRDIINDSIRDMVHIVSTDCGKSFSSPRRISNDNWAINGCPHTGPSISENTTGLQFAWYTMGNGEGVFCCNSNDNGKTFSSRKNISRKPSAKHPQAIGLKNGNLAVAWDEVVQKDEKYFNRVGLQYRNQDGDAIATGFITPDTVDATYPVVREIANNSLLVVYSVKKNNKDEINYKLIPSDKIFPESDDF